MCTIYGDLNLKIVLEIRKIQIKLKATLNFKKKYHLTYCTNQGNCHYQLYVYK